MLSSGQLPSIGNDGLVTRPGSFYANINDWLEYNGRDYDYNLNEVVRTTASEVWDHSSRTPTGDLTRLRN